MITFGDFLKKEQEEYSKLTNEEILQRLIKCAYKYFYEDFCKGYKTEADYEYEIKPLDEYGDHKFTKQYVITDYALEDMLEFLKEYPYMQYIPFGILYELQQKCNADVLSAGWCGCFEPRYMLYSLEHD